MALRDSASGGAAGALAVTNNARARAVIILGFMKEEKVLWMEKKRGSVAAGRRDGVNGRAHRAARMAAVRERRRLGGSGRLYAGKC